MFSIGRIQRFPSSKKLASFFGVHPKFKQSGDKISAVHISKEGRIEARYYLFNIVMSAINFNPWMKELYERYQKKGKSKLSAVGILIHKTTRIIYRMLKNKTEYNTSIDKFNIDRSKEKKTIPTQNKNRRFQDFDSDAPISKRHRKKRHEDILNRERVGVVGSICQYLCPDFFKNSIKSKASCPKVPISYLPGREEI